MNLLVASSPILAIYKFLTPPPARSKSQKESKAERVLGQNVDEVGEGNEVSAVLQIGVGVIFLSFSRFVWTNFVLIPNGWDGTYPRTCG